ncbi:MAG TPA: hypothetical protein VNS88_13680 [Nitrospiraceae bacterium]|nr:hypothetical protein [Nitrospiraceae bacterium]
MSRRAFRAIPKQQFGNRVTALANASLTGTSLTPVAPLATDGPGIRMDNVLTTLSSFTCSFQFSFAIRIGTSVVTLK